MTETETRVANNFPALQMTLISLIVALVYEQLIESVQGQDGLFTLSEPNLLLWAQFLAIAIWPLEYWFTTSLSSSSVRTVFRPRSALGPLSPALLFFGLASNTGAWNPALWLTVAALLHGAAWFALGEQGRHYALDPSLCGGADAHRLSRSLMLASGVVLAAAALFLQMDVLGPAPVGAGIVVALGISLTAHAKWYGEWRRATAPDPAAV